jgi:hypothetical protein
MGPLAETLAASVVCVGMYWRYRIRMVGRDRGIVNRKRLDGLPISSTRRPAAWRGGFCSFAALLVALWLGPVTLSSFFYLLR